MKRHGKQQNGNSWLERRLEVNSGCLIVCSRLNSDQKATPR